ncbi:hypothetical protein BH11MYX4_BH11MYX4_24870 [soil metagenome]
MSPRRLVGSVPALFLVTAALAAPSGRASADQAAEPCDAWDVEYTLAARLKLTDTPMGAGDGNYPIGPGTVVLRFVNASGRYGGPVRMRSYTMRELFRIDSSALFWKTHVLTDTQTVTAPDACGEVAKGELKGVRVQWLTGVSGYRTDGTLTCDGSLCGSFGAPPPGKSELHIPPRAVPFSPFDFAADMKTFTMVTTFVAKTDSPKQTAFLTLAGREVRRACVRVTPCP